MRPLASACSQGGVGGILGVFWIALNFADTPKESEALVNWLTL
jgi:hypothetical protein